jgi:hypothetical protein
MIRIELAEYHASSAEAANEKVGVVDCLNFAAGRVSGFSMNMFHKNLAPLPFVLPDMLQGR